MGWKAAPFTLLILFSGAATAYFLRRPAPLGPAIFAHARPAGAGYYARLQITECMFVCCLNTSPERGYSL